MLMTIQTRRFSFLSWNTPLNTRELKPGQSATTLKEGAYLYRLVAISTDRALAIYQQPYRMNNEAEIIAFDPQDIASIAEKEQINAFGPENRNWRWIER